MLRLIGHLICGHVLGVATEPQMQTKTDSKSATIDSEGGVFHIHGVQFKTLQLDKSLHGKSPTARPTNYHPPIATDRPTPSLTTAAPTPSPTTASPTPLPTVQPIPLPTPQPTPAPTDIQEESGAPDEESVAPGKESSAPPPCPQCAEALTVSTTACCEAGKLCPKTGTCQLWKSMCYLATLMYEDCPCVKEHCRQLQLEGKPCPDPGKMPCEP